MNNVKSYIIMCLQILYHLQDATKPALLFIFQIHVASKCYTMIVK